MNLRSSYGLAMNGRARIGFNAQIVKYVQPEKGVGYSSYRTLKHVPFEEAPAALQYATRARKRFNALMALGSTPEALCTCGHTRAQHGSPEPASNASLCWVADEHGLCECERFVWVWEQPCKRWRTGPLGAFLLPQEEVNNA